MTLTSRRRLRLRRPDARSRWPRAVGRVAYWLLVLALSLVFVLALLAFFESRDAGEVGMTGDHVARVARSG